MFVLDFSKCITYISIIDIFNIELSALKWFGIEKFMGYKSDNEFIHRHRAKWLFIERGRSMTGHSIGVVEAPWRSPDPVSARRLTKYWSVSSAGRPDGIDFQTNVDWISTKMNDAQQVPRGYLHAPAGITCYLHLCIRPVRSLSQPRFSSGEPSPGQNLFRPPGNRINYGALQAGG